MEIGICAGVNKIAKWLVIELDWTGPAILAIAAPTLNAKISPLLDICTWAACQKTELLEI
jgi:hypothetical protein